LGPVRPATLPASLGALLGLVCAACDSSFVQLPRDLPANAGLILFAIETSGRTAFAGSVDSKVDVALSGPRADAQFILKVTAPLESLGLSEGPLSFDTDGCPLAEALQPTQSLALHEDAWSTPSADEESRVADAKLRTSNCPDESRCVPYVVRSVPLPAQGRPLFLTAVGDSLLMGTFSRDLFLMGPDRNPRTVSVPESLGSVSSAWVSPQGQLWISDSKERLYRAQLDFRAASLSVDSGVHVASRVLWMASASTSTNADILTLGSTGSVGRLEGDAWRELRKLDEQPAGMGILGGGLGQQGPDEVLIGTSGDNRLLRFRAGRLDDVTPSSATDAPTVLASFGALGAFAITGELGTLLVWDGSTWRPSQPAASLAGAGKALGAWRGSIFAGGNDQIRQYVDGLGFCPDRWNDLNELRALIPFQDELVGVAGHGDDNVVLFLSAP
jgi:hypothetical protein